MKQQERSVEYGFTIMGLIIAIAVITISATGFGMFFTGVIETMNISANSSFAKYDFSEVLANDSRALNSSVMSNPLDPDSSIIDVVGTYFKFGWNSVKSVVHSIAIVQSIMLYTYEDAPMQVKGFVTLFCVLIGFIALILFLQALLKWYI